MRIIHLAKGFSSGGSALATCHLHQGLLRQGLDSILLVDGPGAPGEKILGLKLPLAGAISKNRHRLDTLPWRFYTGRRQEAFSPAWLPSGTLGRINRLKPDLVHLHYTCGGLLRPEDMARIKAPVVWTLNDMWGVTGGCHHSHECDRYKTHCGACPQLGSQKERDLSHRLFARKLKAWQGFHPTLLVPSRWSAGVLQKSRLLGSERMEVIRHGLDLEMFKPRSLAREDLGLPPDKLLILFGAEDAVNNPYKGFGQLLAALEMIREQSPELEIEVVIFGSHAPAQPPESPYALRFLGPVRNRDLAALYSAVDLFAAPSRQESLGLTVMESLACGTPVVAYGVGGILDTLRHEKTGLMARPQDPADFARCLTVLLTDDDLRMFMGRAARADAEKRFSRDRQIEQYPGLYRDVLERSGIEKP